MKNLYKYIIFIIFLSFFSCSESGDIEIKEGRPGFELIAFIDPINDGLNTRVDQYQGDETDNWSFRRFSSNSLEARPLSETTYKWEEAIGFYSKTGNVEEGSDGRFINEKLVFAKEIAQSSYSSFISSSMEMDMSKLNTNTTIAYFPYTEDPEEKGLELRWVFNDERDNNIPRCIDALIMRPNAGTGNGTSVTNTEFGFNHAFSELIIYRGEGFDKPDDGKKGVKVFLTEGYSHAKLVDFIGADDDNSQRTYYKVFNFFYKENYNLDIENCKKWETWPGKYTLTQSGTAPKKIDVEYVLVPGGFGVGRPSVDYIEIYDNYGNLHKVTDFSLYEDHTLGEKKLNWGERYFLEIKLVGLKPTINPVNIQEWNDVGLISRRDAQGVGSVSEFIDFVNCYNQYNQYNQHERNIEEGEESEIIKKLLNYGDRTIDKNNNKVSWHFYVIDNIEFTGTGSNATIDLLHENDIIDGYNSTLTNLTGQFITTLSGTLLGLNFTVNMAGESSGAFGAIVSQIQGGKVSGCTVNGTVNYPNANVGMLAGSMSGGEVDHCTFSGLLIGKSTFNKIIADSPSVEYDFTSNSSTGIIFSSVNP